MDMAVAGSARYAESTHTADAAKPDRRRGQNGQVRGQTPDMSYATAAVSISGAYEPERAAPLNFARR